MGRGEYLEERVPDLRGTVEKYFGEVTDTREYKGNDLLVVEQPTNPVFERIEVGTLSHANKKDQIAVDIVDRDPTELEPSELEAAEDAVSLKNEFLLEVTGRDAKSRRESMKRAVEDDAPDF